MSKKAVIDKMQNIVSNIFVEVFINKILSFVIGGNPLPLGGGRRLVNL